MQSKTEYLTKQIHGKAHDYSVLLTVRVVVRLFQHHILDLHQPGAAGSLVFLQLHGDEADRLLQPGDHHMLQRVDPPPRLLY